MNHIGLYGLVNNAGIVGNSGVDDLLTPQDYQLAWEVNTLGVIRVTQVFKPFIKKTRWAQASTVKSLGSPLYFRIQKHVSNALVFSELIDPLLGLTRPEVWALSVKKFILDYAGFDCAWLILFRNSFRF